MDYFINITLYILKGSAITIKLFLITILLATPLGLVAAIGKISKNVVLKGILEFYTWIFRGTPLLLQLFFAYYGLPVLGLTLSQFQAASLIFVLNYGAYLTEIFRAGIESIDKGQYEAAKSLGMNYSQTMIIIILTQTIKRVIPPYSNEIITLIKDTALVAAIGMGDILRGAKEILNRDFRVEAFIVAAIVYLILTSIVVIVFKKIERKYSVYQ